MAFAKIFLLSELTYDIIRATNIDRSIRMAISYKKLWKLLIDKDMKKEDLRIKAGISTNTMAKLGKNENVNTDMLVKICSALDCDIADIMEITEEK